MKFVDIRESLASTQASADQATIMSASVIHDLGNLIQIALAAIHILRRSPGMPPEHRMPMLDRARTCLEHAGSLVRQNLGHEPDDRSRACAPHSVIEDVAVLFEAMDEPNLSLSIEVDPSLPDVACDSVGLCRALLNLILNARDAMSGQGMVQITARSVEDGLGGTCVELRISDQGTGISPDRLDQVFSPHFTTKPNGFGGMGLPMVQQFVRAAGGEIFVESKVRVGTGITLRLPKAPAKLE